MKFLCNASILRVQKRFNAQVLFSQLYLRKNITPELVDVLVSGIQPGTSSDHIATYLQDFVRVYRVELKYRNREPMNEATVRVEKKDLDTIFAHIDGTYLHGNELKFSIDAFVDKFKGMRIEKVYKQLEGAPNGRTEWRAQARAWERDHNTKKLSSK